MVWSLPRGFNLTDEAFYLLNYRYPAKYESSVSTFHLMVTWVLGLTDSSLRLYRVVGLASMGLGAGAFGLSLSAWLMAAMPAGWPRR